MTDPTPDAVAMLADTVDHLERACGNMRAALDAIGVPAPERLATPAEMQPGGWVRFPGAALWRQITTVVVGHPSETVIEYRHAGATHSVSVCPWDTLPYLPDAEFQAICDGRQAAEDVAADGLLFAEWEAGR